MCQVLLGTHPRFFFCAVGLTDGVTVRPISSGQFIQVGLLNLILNYSVYSFTLHPTAQPESVAFGEPCPRFGDSVDEMWWQPFSTYLDRKNLWKKGRNLRSPFKDSLTGEKESIMANLRHSIQR
jgi:hypothetical protein